MYSFIINHHYTYYVNRVFRPALCGVPSCKYIVVDLCPHLYNKINNHFRSYLIILNLATETNLPQVSSGPSRCSQAMHLATWCEVMLSKVTASILIAEGAAPESLAVLRGVQNDDREFSRWTIRSSVTQTETQAK